MIMIIIIIIIITIILKNIVLRNGKKESHNKVSCNYLESPTHAYRNSRKSQY